MASNPDQVRDYAKRRLSAARASKNLSWSELSRAMQELGFDVTDSTLTTRHSRGTFKAIEFLALLRIMGVRFLDLSELDLDGLDEAIRKAAEGARKGQR